jgi:hypothetical protein
MSDSKGISMGPFCKDAVEFEADIKHVLSRAPTKRMVLVGDKRGLWLSRASGEKSTTGILVTASSGYKRLRGYKQYHWNDSGARAKAFNASSKVDWLF